MMEDEKIEEKWAGNFAFTGNEATVKKVKKILDELEANGEIDDITGILGPHESLQLMLKRRVENLALGAGLEPSKPNLIQNTELAQGDSSSDGNKNE